MTTKAGFLGKLLSLVLACLLFGGPIALAQQAPPPSIPALTALPMAKAPAAEKPVPDYGTTKLTYIQVGGAAFSPMSSTGPFATANNGYTGQVLRTGGAAFVYFSAPVSVPSGALVRSVELDACDDTGALGYVQGSLVTSDSLGNVTSFTPFLLSNGTTAPACKAAIADVTAMNIVSNNLTQHQWLIASVSIATGFNVGLAGMKVGYQLQVSPAPATATFGDVPTTSPQFKFIEALASAGITGGCGGGNYCPGDSVTRGQMAVFLAVALGLEFQ
jgi:S-layer homology domain